jgi:hypothetical protein
VLGSPALQVPTTAIEPPQEWNLMGNWRLNVTEKDITGGQIRITREAKRDLHGARTGS